MESYCLLVTLLPKFFQQKSLFFSELADSSSKCLHNGRAFQKQGENLKFIRKIIDFAMQISYSQITHLLLIQRVAGWS